MTRVTIAVIYIAGLVSIATGFTQITTTASKHSQYKRKRDADVLLPMYSFITERQMILACPKSTTSLFGENDSTTSSVDDSPSMLDGVVELGEPTKSDTIKQNETTRPPNLVEQAVAPFLSQGEIDPQTLNPDLSDPKQARVILYIILSLVPVLFLIPLMIGSRDLIPLDAVSPVQL